MAGVSDTFRISAGDRVVVIANPATRVDARAVDSALRAEVPPHVSLDVLWTDAAGDAKSLAREAARDARCLIAIGGDGTVGEVASALVGTDIPLGIIPGGSTNIVARSHGIPKNPRLAAHAIFDASHEVVEMDVALCNDRPFLHMAGAGFDSQMFARADQALKRKAGWVAYLPAAMQALRLPPASVRITADGEALETRSPMVLVANGAAIIAPALTLSPGIRSDDGWLDLIVVTATRPHQLASVVGRLASLHFASSPWVIHRRVREVVLETGTPVPVQLDGDLAGETPARFGILPRALKVIVPKGQGADSMER